VRELSRPLEAGNADGRAGQMQAATPAKPAWPPSGIASDAAAGAP